MSDAGVEADAGFEAGAEELPELRPLCPPPRAPSRPPPESTTRVLYEPDTLPRFPFSITSDAKFVYWVEQDTNGDGYNGQAFARILRIPRAGGDAVELATHQPGVTALALDGEYVYWATFPGGETPAVANILRARRLCASGPCPPESFANLAVGRVTELLRAEAGVLYARGGSSVVRIDTSGSATPRTAPTEGAASGLALGASNVFVTSTSSANFTAFAPDLASWSSFSPVSSADPITSLASDCETLWATTKSSLLGVRASSQALTSSAQVVLPDTFDSAVDAQYLYVARANAGGIDSILKATGAQQHLWDGNVFALHVDDEGVYWGDHAPKSGGRLYMLEK